MSVEGRGFRQGVGIGMGCCAAPFVIAGLLALLGIVAFAWWAFSTTPEPLGGAPPAPSVNAPRAR